MLLLSVAALNLLLITLYLLSHQIYLTTFCMSFENFPSVFQTQADSGTAAATPLNWSEYNAQYKSNDFSAVASSALSSQISSIMNSFTDKVQLGTNIRTSQDGIEDTEVEMLLSSQLLNNRLIFNGNFGYKNSTINNQKNAFIGEFDLEYLLTPSGDIRLKAYNHANDMYMILKQALTTQGVGIMYKKDFTRFSDIFRRRKKYPLIPLRPTVPDSTLQTPVTTEQIPTATEHTKK